MSSVNHSIPLSGSHAAHALLGAFPFFLSIVLFCSFTSFPQSPVLWTNIHSIARKKEVLAIIFIYLFVMSSPSLRLWSCECAAIKWMLWNSPLLKDVDYTSWMEPRFPRLIIYLQRRRNARWKEEVTNLRKARVEGRTQRFKLRTWKLH